jgi:3'(2'), 5'-bisphosphate nucleotidase
MDLSEDHALAARLATTAGELLLRLRDDALVEGKALGALGDRVANAFLMGALESLRAEDGILSEEEAPNTARLSKSRVWIIDPLDGTREYSEGRADWAVHVALTIDGRPVAGAVAIPGLGVTYATGSPAPVAACEARRILVSRTRPPVEAEPVAKALGGALEGMGSAGAKAMAVVRGEALAYVHSGGQYEWDSCAPVVVARAMGLHVSRIDGSEPLYNRPDPYMPDLVVCRPELAGQILEAAGRAKTSA